MFIMAKNKYSIFQSFIRVSSLPFTLLYLLSILAYVVDSSQFPWIAVMGFLMIPLFLFQIVLLLFVKSRWKLRLVFLLLIIVGMFLSTKVYQFPKNQHSKGLKIMSWNVKCFDLYDWNKNEHTRKKMIALIDSVDADILCFQEFYTDTHHFDNIEAMRRLGYPYVHFQQTLTHLKHQKWGVATFSKYPIVGKDVIKIDEVKHNIALCTQVRIRDSVFSIYNAHFQSLHFSFEDYDYIEQLKNEYEYDGFKNRLLLSKIFKAYPLRVKQVKSILEHIAQSKNTRVILAADMNDIPISYCFHQLGNVLQDAFLKKGSGTSQTIDLVNPLLRIDYIFHSKNLTTNSYQVIYRKLSDHYPVVVHVN